MRLEVIRWQEASAPSEAELRERLEREGYSVIAWTDRPNAHYGAHSHERDESIWLVSGRIRFVARGEELALSPGDRLMLPAGTVHVADAGPAGARYLIGEKA